MFDVEKFISSVEQCPALYDVSATEYGNRKVKAECWARVAQDMYADWRELSPAEKEVRERTLIKKWKAIRDNFVRDYKIVAKTGMPLKKKYAYYDRLLFLAPYVKPNDTSDTVPVVVEYANEYESGSDTLPDRRTSRTKSTRRTSVRSKPILDDEEKIHFLSKMVFDEDSESEIPNRPKRAKSFSSVDAEDQAVTLVSENLTRALEESSALRREDRDRSGNRAFLMSFAPFMDALPRHKQMEARLRGSQLFNSLVTSADHVECLGSAYEPS